MLPILPLIIAASAAAGLAYTSKKAKEHRKRGEQFQTLSAWLKQNGFALNPNGSIDPNAKSEDGTPYIIQAVKQSRKDILQSMIDLGADPNAMNVQGNTALFYVQEESLARILIANGAIVNAQNVEGKTPLHTAEDRNIIDILIQNNAEINARDIHGRTAIFNRQSSETIKVLLDRGADPLIQDEEGKTALFYLPNDDRQAKRSQLLLIRANPQIKKIADNCGNLPAIILNSDSQDYELYEKLRDALRSNNYEESERLLESGANPNLIPIEDHGWNALNLPIYNHNPKLIHLLANYGADFSLKDNNISPLMHAIIDNEIECVKALLKNGAPIGEAEIRHAKDSTQEIKALILKS